MNIKDMSAEQRKEELARLADRLISSGLAGTLQHFD